jgi:hypothetical protein
MKRIVLLCIALLFISNTLLAQRRQHLTKGDLFARLSITDLVNPLDNSLTVGAAYMLHQRWSVAADAGYIFNSTGNNGIRNSKTNGLISKAALRWHYTRSKRSFVELMGYYKTYTYFVNGWLGMDCVGGVPAYQKWDAYKAKKAITGAVLKWGYTGQLGKKGKLWYEVSAGLTFKAVTQKPVEQPANTCIVETINNTTFSGATDTPLEENPGIQIGIKLLYRWKHR